MSYKIDNRGSKDQKILYDFLTELYPTYNIIYEFPLYDLNQRIDIYIPNLALAIEYDGRQHVDFIEHFHKDIETFKLHQKMDIQKNEYLLLHGIKLIRILYNEMVKDKDELLKIITDTPYPDFPFIPLPEKSNNEISFKRKEKEKRQEAYKNTKVFYTEDKDKKKERLEKERQFRKERYENYKKKRE